MNRSILQLIVAGVCTSAVGAGAAGMRGSQAPQVTPAGPAGRGGGRGAGPGAAVFTLADINRDGMVTRAELTTTLEKWFAEASATSAGAASQDQLATALNGVLPPPAAPLPDAGYGAGSPNLPVCGGFSSNPHTPCPEDVAKMLAALPAKADVVPARPRTVLVLDISMGYHHPSAPLAAETVKALGEKTKAWRTVISFDAADINVENLSNYDAIFLDSTTGCFLDKPGDAAQTAARRAALIGFVRGGKGVAGIHAAADSYHSPCPNDASATGRGGGRAGGQGQQLAAQILMQADNDHDQKVSLTEIDSLADAWFDRLDRARTGRVSQADFTSGFAALLPQPQPVGGGPGTSAAAAVARGAGPQPQGTWPEFNTLIGGIFKFHWPDTQRITVKIDDPGNPLTQMFQGKEWEIQDETYTFAQNSFSRANVHVLTSIDYAKMSDADKALEPAGTARTDGDYALSWIRREGEGRVFYEALLHREANYAVTPLLAHMLAGIQYALGDLKADDSPSVKPGR
jgi:type 1 glutamine amidotransferase